MKKYLFSLIVIVLFSINARSAAIDSYVIQSQYLQNSPTLKVYSTTATEFKADVTITRNIKSYGYENVDWLVTLIYQDGAKEIELSEPVAITGNTFNSNAYYKAVLTGKVPANKIGGEVKVKYTYIFYNNEGIPISDKRSVGYSNNSFRTELSLSNNPGPGPGPNPISYNPNNLRLFASNLTGQNFRKIDYESGGYLNFGKQEWRTIDGITALNNYLYVLSTGTLHRVDPSNGTWTALGTIGDWKGPAAMTKSVTDGYLYIVQNDRIHRVNPNNGDYNVIGQPEWRGVRSILEYKNDLYLVENNDFYRVDKTTGSYTKLGNQSWPGTKGIVNDEQGNFYIVCNGEVRKVNPADGSYTLLAKDSAPTNYNGIAIYNESLYIFRNSRLYVINKQTGSTTLIGNPDFGGCEYLTIL